MNKMISNTFKKIENLCPERNECQGFKDIVEIRFENKVKTMKLYDLICYDYEKCGAYNLRKQVKTRESIKE